MGNSPASQRPLIGVTVEVLEPPAYEGRRRYQLFTDYLESCLRQAGGIGLLIPGDTPVNDVDSVLKVLDGILLTGGDDIDLQPLGGPSPPKTSKPIPLAQQTFSIALAEAAREQRIPTLGICLGMQLLSSKEMYGRVMSISMMTWGLMPLGIIPLSALAAQVGTPDALAASAVALVIVSAVFPIFNKTIRQLKA